MQRPAVEFRFDVALQHRPLRHVGAPAPEPREFLLVPDDYFTRNQRMAVEAARQRAHAHAIRDAELQRLHLLTLSGIVTLPGLNVALSSEAAHQRE